MNTKKAFFLTLAFLLWLTFILAIFHIYQKPVFVQVSRGLAATLWTVFLALVIFLASSGLGAWILKRFKLDQLHEMDRLVLGCGLGLGVFSLAGFGLAVIGLAKPIVLSALLIALLAWLGLKGHLRSLLSDMGTLRHNWKEALKESPPLLRIAIPVAVFLVILLALAPPVEAFDALLYHLTMPAMWLEDGGLRLVNLSSYWFPALVEGIFVWPMGLGSDTAPQLIHFVFAMLSALLLWDWARRLWSAKVAWWAIALMLTMPSILWLAAWAYTDLALSFYALALLYSLWKWKATANNGWLWVGGLMAGFAISIKYTSFPIPLLAVFFILFWGRKEIKKSLLQALIFTILTLLTALPWYLRTWIFTGNPFYPFIFGGPFWDSFRSQHYAATGSGIGWDLKALLLLPFDITLGNHDVTYYDGRIGPFFLALLPLVIGVLWGSRRQSSSQRNAVYLLTAYTSLSVGMWIFGVIQTSNLWQARLLFPALIPFLLVLAIGVDQLRHLDLQRLKISFIFSVVLAIMLLTGLLDFGLQVFHRNPLMVAIGAETRQEYMARLQPGYASALDLAAQTPADSSIYFLFEPRSYAMPRNVQPDFLNDNLAHEFYLHHNAANVVSALRDQGFTHILISRTGADFIFAASPEQETQLLQLTTLLIMVNASPDGNVEIYAIPAPEG